MLRRIAAGAGRWGQWHLMLADVLSQINGRKHATTQVAPNLAYSDPEMAEIALRNIGRRAKHKVTRPEIKVGDMVRIRVKPIESRGSYRVNKIAWSEKVQGSLRREVWLGGVAGKWCTGIFEKSPKTQLPNRGGWRRPPGSKTTEQNVPTKPAAPKRKPKPPPLKTAPAEAPPPAEARLNRGASAHKRAAARPAHAGIRL